MNKEDIDEVGIDLIENHKDYKDIPEDWSKEYFSMIERQIGIFSFEDQKKIKNTHIGALGCGGASPIVEILVRLGCENITICDKDKWEFSNIGRTVCHFNDIGKYKVDTVEELAKSINPNVKIRKFYEITPENVSKILDGVEIAYCMLDEAVGNIIAARECRKRNINFVLCPMMPFIFSLWFTKDSITAEEICGLSPDMSVEEIIKNADRARSSMVQKYFKLPNVLEKYQRNMDGFKRMMEKAKYRVCGLFTHFNSTYLAFEIIFTGILKLKKMILAPETIAFDYFDQKLYKIDFSKIKIYKSI